MSDRVVGWSVLGRSNSTVLVCARCLEADEAFDPDLLRNRQDLWIGFCADHATAS